MRFPFVLLAAALTAAPARTQATFTIPQVLARSTGGALSALPFGSTRTFTQVWYRGDGMPAGTSWSEFGIRAQEGTIRTGVTARFELVLDNSSVAFDGLSQVFAQNLSPQATVVFAMKNVSLPPSTTPATPLVEILLDAPFVFTGPHLLVQIDHQTTSTPQPFGLRADALQMQTTQVADTGSIGTTCGGGGLAASYGNDTFTLTLGNAAPGALLSFVLGVDNQLLGGTLPLPLDLTSFGMPGCGLQVDPLVTVPAVVNSMGRATLAVPYAAPVASESVGLFAQALHGGAATPSGLIVTNGARALLGNHGYLNMLFNYNVVGPTAEAGPYTANRGPVMFLR